MPSRLKKAIGAVKDQTSISIAKVSSNNSCKLGIIVLKATSHDELPLDEPHLNDIISLVSSDRVNAAACATAIGKRIGRTRNWIVAIKSISLVFAIFQHGTPYFPKEVFHAMKRGAKILNLSSFRDVSNSSPWDYTAFVRAYALYIDERLDCFLSGKLNRLFVKDTKRTVQDMNPGMMMDQIVYWQRLLDRAIATQPTGAAKSNRLVKVTLHAVVQESFYLYWDISEGLALLLDSFFRLQYQSCVYAFQTCVRATKQFEELSNFYSLCKAIGVGRTSEYPSVQKISEELVETLREFLKDQSDQTINSPGQSLLPKPRPHDSGSENSEGNEQSEAESDRGSSLQNLFESPSDSDLAFKQFSTSTTRIDENLTSFDQNPKEDKYTSSCHSWPQETENNNEEIKEEQGKSSEEEWKVILLGSASQYNSDSSPEEEWQTTHKNNPFLFNKPEGILSMDDSFAVTPTFQATPMFCASNVDNEKETHIPMGDPFVAVATNGGGEESDEGQVGKRKMLREQQLWVERQNKIIGKRR